MNMYIIGMGCYDSAFYPQRSYPQAFVAVCFLQDEVHDVGMPRDYMVRWARLQASGPWRTARGSSVDFIGLGVACLSPHTWGNWDEFGGSLLLVLELWVCLGRRLSSGPASRYCMLYIIW